MVTPERSMSRIGRGAETVEPDVRATVRRYLEAERAALLRRQGATRQALSPDATLDSGDESAQQALDLERDVEAVLDQRAQDALREIGEAIERLDEGRFGRCDDCGEPIGKARLLAIPHARRCLGCQDRVETQRR
jgi:RNA polymerase-binding transcription factor